MREGDRLLDRRAGLEQEFFLVENSGHPSKRADEFLDAAGLTEENPASAACFAPEFVLGLVEVNTPPVYTLSDLEREYAQNLRIALRTARSLGLRLYPLGTYPLPLEPAVRDGLDYRVQVDTVGPERFVDAGRCAGTHLHLELQAGTVDDGAGISATASAAAREEVSNIYNLATALDPALVALTRSCPFFEGQGDGTGRPHRPLQGQRHLRVGRSLYGAAPGWRLATLRRRRGTPDPAAVRPLRGLAQPPWTGPAYRDATSPRRAETCSGRPGTPCVSTARERWSCAAWTATTPR